MVTKTVTVTHSLGIHARAAGAIVRLSRSFRSKITLQRNGTLASAKSIMELLMLGAGGGSRVLVSAVGEDEREALSAVEKLIALQFQPGCVGR
jgi:phosphotransferase system HPr (HPr) family protein